MVLQLFTLLRDVFTIERPWADVSDGKQASFRMNDRNLWGIRRGAAEAEVVFPFLMLHPTLAEQILHIIEFLLCINVLTCCILAFVFLFQCTNDDELEQIYQFQQTRRELVLRLARSIHEYQDVVIPIL
jgi:hypothetical protein